MENTMNDKIILKTNRLIVRRVNEKDVEELYEILSDPEVVKYEPYRPMSFTEVKDSLLWRISTSEMIAIELEANHKMIGNVYLGKRDFNSLELGYILNKEYWHFGYAKEACMAIINFSFSDGIHRIYAECDPDNISSWKLLESLGFIKEAFFRENVYFFKDKNDKPTWKNTFVYSKINDKDN